MRAADQPDDTGALAGFRASPEGPALVIALYGEVDASNADGLLDRMAEVVASTGAVDGDVGARGLVADLSEVTYLGSSGIRLLTRLKQQLLALGAGLAVVAPPATISARLLELTGVADHLGAVPSRAAAIHALGALG